MDATFLHFACTVQRCQDGQSWSPELGLVCGGGCTCGGQWCAEVKSPLMMLHLQTHQGMISAAGVPHGSKAMGRDADTVTNNNLTKKLNEPKQWQARSSGTAARTVWMPSVTFLTNTCKNLKPAKPFTYHRPVTVPKKHVLSIGLEFETCQLLFTGATRTPTPRCLATTRASPRVSFPPPPRGFSLSTSLNLTLAPKITFSATQASPRTLTCSWLHSRRRRCWR